MSFSSDDKPETPVVFTQQEQAENQKTCVLIQQNFLRQHQEITAPAASDMASMIRQEKQMYASLAIVYAVNAIAAMNKKKDLG